VWNLIAILALVAAAPGDVIATRLDGTAVSGQLQDWSADGVVLKTTAGSATIPAADLVSLEFSVQSTADTGEPTLELVDGTILPLAKFTTNDDTLTGKLQTSSPASTQPISVALEQVRAVRLQPLDPAILPQWEEIRASGAPSDLLVLLKRGGKSLDYLEGVIGKFSVDQVEFTLDEKTVNVARGKVAGIVYFRPEDRQEPIPQCVLRGKNGTLISAASVRWSKETLDVVTVAGPKLAWPLSEIAEADFSAGKIAFLADLHPVSQSWQPLIGLPPSALHAAKFGQPRFNQSAIGGPLSLNFPSDAELGGSPRTETFAKGLAVRSRTELVFRLPSGFSRFMALAGIEPTDAASGNVTLTIFGDDRMLTEATIAGSSRPLPLDLDVAGVKRLKIVVDYGQNLDTGDWLNLCNARIVK
jgi:NPCBM/NEW2 domain